jgi:molybdopterin synthase sulfur carrier subunit
VSDTRAVPGVSETQVIQVRYWAAARTAAGCDAEEIPVTGPMTLTDVLAEAVRRHPGTRLADVLGVCSVLLGDRPVATEDPGELLVQPGATLEFLPPFAGG